MPCHKILLGLIIIGIFALKINANCLRKEKGPSCCTRSIIGPQTHRCAQPEYVLPTPTTENCACPKEIMENVLPAKLPCPKQSKPKFGTYKVKAARPSYPQHKTEYNIIYQIVSLTPSQEQDYLSGSINPNTQLNELLEVIPMEPARKSKALAHGVLQKPVNHIKHHYQSIDTSYPIRRATKLMRVDNYAGQYRYDNSLSSKKLKMVKSRPCVVCKKPRSKSASGTS